AGIRALERFAQLFRDQPQELVPELELHVRAQGDRAVHHNAALARRKRRHIGPPSSEIEPQRRARVKFRGEIAPSHCCTCHMTTLGSSPRMSMRTPRTRWFIAWTPRAWYSHTTGCRSTNTRCAKTGSAGTGIPVSSRSG